MIAAQPIALQLRFLQTMSEIASEHNTTTFIPLPIDLFTPFLRKAGDETAKQSTLTPHGMMLAGSGAGQQKESMLKLLFAEVRVQPCETHFVA
jgi:hypothetical protein